MRHYEFHQTFHALYDKAVLLYSKGQHTAATLFLPEEIAFLSANGITPQYMFDYAEDHNNYGEPGFEIAYGIELVRRDYFLNVQGGKPSTVILDEMVLPAKSDAVKGIEWLPRIIPKAKAKLRGELPASLMYCCGGDRKFFKTHDIHPVEFLSAVWRNLDSNANIIDWVSARSNARRAA